ncbi:MAG: LEPR-XLL domain-containing protein, partial [Methylococcaceae bacterium]
MKKLNSHHRTHLFNIETLEQRILLSADPIVGELVQQYYNANSKNLGELRVAESTTSGNVLLKQAAQENASLNRLDLNLATVKNQNFALNTINVQDFSNFQNADGRIVIGNENSNAIVTLGDLKTDDGKLAFNQNLLISTPKNGGEIFIDDDLVGGKNADLTIHGSGHTTTLSANISTTNTNITINDSLKISGARTIASGASIQLGSASNHFLDGDSALGDDSLTLTAAATTGNIIVKGIVGGTDALEGLTITGTTVGTKVNNVTFESDVTVNGDVTIDASGTVTFNAALNITGHLTINGANLVVFGNNVVVGAGKDILLESDEITFNGGQESVRGTGTLTMRPTTLSNDIAIASPPAENTANTLNLSSNELITLADGFSKITIGRENTGHANATATGTIYIGSKAANQNTFTDALEIFGKNIEIKDYSNPDFKFQNKDTIKLDALENILIYNEVKAIDGTTNKNITLYSAGGEIKQVSNDTDALVTESIGAGDLTITSSKGIDLGWVNAVNVTATNTTSGNIKINSNAPIAVTTTFTAITGVLTSSIALSSDINNLVLNTPLNTSSGSITVNSGGTLIINNPISTASGTIDIKSKNDLTLNAIISTTGSSPISFTSTAASIFQKVDITSATAGGLITLTAAVNIDMLDGKKISTGSVVSGTITLTAGSDIKVSILEATTVINVTATAGAIIDNLTGETSSDLNIKGTTTVATLKAGKGIGSALDDMDTLITTLSATNDLTVGATGGIFISEIDALTIGAGGIKSSGGDGSVVILTTGLLTIAGSIDVSGAAGNILLQNASSDILLNGLVKSASGNISIITLAGSIIHSAAGDIEISTDVTKTIELESALAITMVDGAVIKTKGGSVRLNAKSGNIQIGSIDAVSGSLSLLTTNSFSIFDVEGTDSDTDITAENYRITTKSLGTTSNALDINVTNLSVATVDGLFLSEANGVIVKEIPIISVNRVGIAAAITALTDLAVQSGLQSTNSGAIVLTTISGDITLDKSVIAGGVQNVLLNAKGNLKINALVNVSSGSVNLISGATLTQTADGDILTAGGTLDVNAVTAIVMADGAETKTTDKDIRYKTTTGDISLGFIDAGTGSVAILAGGNIVDVESTIAVPAVDIKAKALNLTAGNGVTTAENPLEINVDNLTATTSGVGGIFLLESNAISVEQVSVTVNLVSTAGANSADTPIIASDLATSNGSIILNAADITLKDSNSNNKVVSAIGSGNILLNANNGNLIFDSSINTGSGNISLVATGNIVASSTSQILTNSLGTIDLMATSGINMMNGAKIQTSNTNIRLNASTGDITIGQINAGTANVSLITGGQIFDGNDTGIDVVAGGLRLNAMTGVGKSDNALDINVITLSGMVSNGSFFISDATGITVTTIDALSVNRVDNKAAVTPVIDAAQSDLISAANGSIILTALAGDIIILDGNTDGKSLFTTSTGNILLNAVGGISVQADINANGGNITLLSSASIIQGSVGNIVTVGKGTIDLSAAVAINVAIGAKIQTAGGNIRLNAVESMTLSGVNAVTGSVSLSANSILGSNSDNVLDIVATNLRINAISAGTGTNALNINVDNLTAVMTNGGLFINEANGITVTEIPAIVVNRVAATGLIADITDLKQSNLSSLAGAIVLTTQAGDITVLDGNSDAKGVTTQSGNILLNAAANLNIQSAIENVSGNISLISGAMLSQSATGNLTTVNSGTIDVTAATILMANGSTTKTADTNIRYTSTGGDITVGILNAGKANIALFAAKNIVDANTTATDIFASGVNFVAAGIGSVTNPLEIAASKLTANASASGMFITDTDAVSVEKVNIAVFKVDLTGIATASEIVTGSDLKTIMGAILLNAPKITITDGNNDNKGVTSTSGDISLNATADALELQSSVSSGSGNLVLSSSAALKQGATGHIFTSEAGSINLTAG